MKPSGLHTQAFLKKRQLGSNDPKLHLAGFTNHRLIPWGIPHQLDLGILPPGTELTPRPEWIQEWATLPEEEKRAYARMMEVYAGFLTHTDHHVGRVFDHLEAIGRSEERRVGKEC